MKVAKLIAVAAALVFGGFCFVSGAAANERTPTCKVPTSLTDLEQPLPRTAARLAGGEPIKIVAIGSSSTAGAGASAPAASYPNRLAAELATQFPGADITVVNRGINGQESGDMLARLKADVIEEKPTLVIWQLGTNSVLRHMPIEQVSESLEAGVAQIRDAGADVILVDPQFAPRVISMPDTEAMVKLITDNARKLRIGMFHRFAVMRHWHDVSDASFDTFTSPDGLHMNDWGYACWAKLLTAGIAQAVARPTLSAHASPAVRANTARTPSQ